MRVPRENLINSTGDVTERGEYVTPYKVRMKNFEMISLDSAALYSTKSVFTQEQIQMEIEISIHLKSLGKRWDLSSM